MAPSRQPNSTQKSWFGSRAAKLLLVAMLATSAVAQADDKDGTKTIIEDVFDPDVGQLVKKTIVVDPKLKAAKIDDIEPDAGPTFGDTRVIVKGGPFTQQIQDQYPHPMCRFGHDDMIVPGTYILCKAEKFQIEQQEARHKDKNDVCIACDNSPPSAKSEIISFTISLTGDFSDTQNSLPYRYYPNPTVFAIYPRYGPKDGKTIVQVWGEGFLNFDTDTRCSFGSKTVIATFVNSNYMICESPFSDVVQKPISFTVLLNKQQNSKGNVNFWYYSWPSIVQLLPNAGPDQGGTEVFVKGNNFNPFKDEGIDNHNDTFIMFEGLGKLPVEVFNSTRVRVYSPPSYILRKSIVEITLNNQQYTDDNTIFYYYRPPNLFDAKPREGPVTGGTTVVALGSNFRDTGNITCRFDETVVKAEYISETEIHCVSPPHEKPGFVPFAVSLERGMYSPPLQYLYYDKPVIYSIGPICGPDYGYTQIAVNGKNFVDMGVNKAFCVFNQTIFTNATIFSNELIYCDSPPFMDKFGHSRIMTGSEFYNVEVTIDGGSSVNGPFQKFMYYRDPDINVITPPRGPLKGGTIVRIDGKGFNQEGACNKWVRFGTMETRPFNETEDTVAYAVAPGGDPLVNLPDQVVVSVALNGQQFAHDKILHIRDDENTYEYYEDPIIGGFNPKKGPKQGGTPIKIHGVGFTPLKNVDGDPDMKRNKVWIRFVDPDTHELVAPETQVKPEELFDDQLTWRTPPSNGIEKPLMEMSLNDQDWIPIPEAGQPHSFTYFDPPHITKLTPSFGPVKDKRNRTMDIEGVNFFCPGGSCKKTLMVRFGEPPNQQILLKGEWISDNLIRCRIPKYTKPDVLRVEITLNGEDWTNDQKTYGYFDPYVLDVQPRLISTEGSTRIKIKGFGFVNSGTVQSKFDSAKEHLVTGGKNDAIQDATFIDKNTIESGTYPQTALNYEKSSQNIWWDAMTVEVSVYEGDFTENGLEIFYIQDPVFGTPNLDESPANVENQLFIPTDFKNTDPKLLEKYGNLTCRFTAEDGTVMYTKAKMISVPVGAVGEKPNTLQCPTPKWDLHGKPSEKCKLDLSLNGQDYKGGFDFTFVQQLLIYRTVPMAGPVQGNTKTRIIGQGFKPSKSHVDLKWGVLNTEIIVKEQVTDYVYYKTQFENMIEGSEEIKAYVYEARDFQRVDMEMFDEFNYHSIYLQTPQLSWWNRTHGGPYYVEVGKDIKIEVTNSMQGMVLSGFNGNEEVKVISSEDLKEGVETSVEVKTEAAASAQPANATQASNTTTVAVAQKESRSKFWTFYEYDASNVEYYYYKDCITKEVGPHSALTTGGTPVSLVGAWYKYMPEYGVVPHCRFGKKIVRAQFDSTVRIVCIAPPVPNLEEDDDTSLWVSLNGVDFADTGVKFTYYDQPIITGIWPNSGPEQGGVQVFITGQNFTNMTDPVAFNCKFTPFHLKTPPKTMPATYYNDTMVSCPTPGGWGQGDIMHIQLSFNGADYDDYNNTFTFYSISRAFPRSGPSDGTGGDILIEGYGFSNDTTPLCMLNNTVYLAREVTWTYIKCPMPPAEAGPDFFGNVNLKVSPNGGTRDEDWHNFQGGFQYYQQPIVEDIFPKQGPNEGTGVINFYGEGFRADYPLAQLGCRVGQRVGRAVYVSSKQIKCVIEKLDLIEEGESSPAQVALNSYSWSKILPTTQFYPYGMNSIYPNSGPTTGVTDVIVEGKGFQYISHLTISDVDDEDLQGQSRLEENEVLSAQLSSDATNARCRFGTPGNYAIVDAQILSYERMVCRAPQDFTLKDAQKFPLDVPFSIAFSNDEFDPWTDTSHKFRFYENPIVAKSEPFEVEVGTISEVLVFAEEPTEFFDPIMINKPITQGEEGNAPLQVGGIGGIMCRFGRFGETQGIFINETIVKCVTPAVEDDPDSIFRETVKLTVAMNGQDHDEEASNADFTFIGTGSYMVFWPFLIGALLLGLLIVALIVCCSALFTRLSLANPMDPHTMALGEGIAVPKGRADWSKERSSVDMLERASGQQFYLRNQFAR